ncbi:Methylenetetrahydrofolate--tRNA-(uracil-5-)- methyltransferase TrmFO [Lactococcus lactis]|nr:Methylenetetrahydrofolate--tRNA-(uracil-5-)- methyltransferase TrmFO [Lactococcus lactis]
MKPVGLEYPEEYKGPRDGDFKTPYAVVQLRQDNASASLYNIVGFQTHLKWEIQKNEFLNDSRSKMLNRRMDHHSNFLHGFSKSS